MQFDSLNNTDIKSLNRNFKQLKQSLNKLIYVYSEGVSSKVSDKITHLVGMLNGGINRCNEWSKGLLVNHHKSKKEREELQLQINVMEGEGNVIQMSK